MLAGRTPLSLAGEHSHLEVLNQISCSGPMFLQYQTPLVTNSFLMTGIKLPT